MTMMIKFNGTYWELKSISPLGSTAFLHFLSEDGKHQHNNSIINFMETYRNDNEFKNLVDKLVAEYNRNRKSHNDKSGN